jgi:hypothetical protein
MARFYSNENFPFPVVRRLRQLGHDVVTSLETGNANRAVPDVEVLGFAAVEGRILLTLNRLHFLRLHQRQIVSHAGIVLCTFDPDFERLASTIHERVAAEETMVGAVVRVYRPSK